MATRSGHQANAAQLIRRARLTALCRDLQYGSFVKSISTLVAQKLRSFAILAAVTLACGCGSAEQSNTDSLSTAASHQRMVELLGKIKKRVPEENDALGTSQLRFAKAEYERLPSTAPDKERIRLITDIGDHYLRLGQTQLAVSHLLKAHDILSDTPRASHTRYKNVVLFKLAVAYLRQAEDENCVECTKDSCIFPIRGEGIHLQETGSRKAIEYLTKLLEREPGHLSARWLLNIAWMTLGGFPEQVPQQFLIPEESFTSDEEFPRFVNIAPQLGLDTFSLAGGSIVDDFDDDGWLDVVVSTWNPAGQLRYFRNNGDGIFTERTDKAGLTGIFGGLNLIQADYDNDGDIDIFVLRGAWMQEKGRHPNSLLRNDGKGNFQDVTFQAGLGDVHYPTQTAAWSDYDNDGDLDLYIGNELYPSQLFRNDGQGRFEDVAQTAGVVNERFAKGVTWGDYNGDRFPDLYVSNMGENRLYRNNQDGTFTDVASQVGVARPIRSFPVWFWDFNNDGALDLFVSSYWQDVGYAAADYLGISSQAEQLCLYQGDGKGGFREVAKQQNLTRIAQPMGCNFGDLDNDGFSDFYLGTGYPEYEGLMPNLMFRNRQGEGFSDVTTAGGFGHLQKGHGVAFADIDNDGDQDVFLENGGWYAGDKFGNSLFENPGFGNHSITLKLIGKQSNRSAIGARIHIEIEENGTKRSIYKWVNSGGSFGANPLRQEIGLRGASRIDVLEILWPTSGLTQRFKNVQANQFIEITEGVPQFRRRPWPSD